jgi:cellulose synthase/poly-beta-1,6-N-acetylglucosamine synthase-like glycosyltransferase
MLDLILVIAIAAYSVRTVLFLIGNYIENKKDRKSGESVEFPLVSVIIPARNEEENIEQCIRSVALNNYPQSRYEIIIVNDRSTDKTGEILTTLESKYDNLRVITVAGESRYPNLKGKPGALQTGFDGASGEILLMTDADCTVSQSWISRMVARYSDPKVGLVASFTDVASNKMFEKFQAIEWLYMHTMARGGIGLRQSLGCFGNNLSIRRHVLDEIGGYSKIRFSVTEDLALLQEVERSGYCIGYIRSEESLVTTKPCTKVKEYISQRHRWAVGGMDLGLKAVFFVLSSTLVWLGILISALTCNLGWFVAIMAARLLGDFWLIETTLKKLKRQKYLLLIIPAVITFMLMELMSPLFLLKRKVRWKGQIFTNTSK